MELEEKVRVLNQLRHLKREVDQLSQRIAVMDDAYRLRRAKLVARRQRCMEQLGALYDFIDDIEDSQMRQIMTCRYIDGHPWRIVAAYIGERDEQYPRRLHNRYLRKTELPEALTDPDGNGKDGRGEHGSCV